MSPLPPPARPPPAPVDPALVPHDSAGAQVNSVQWTLFSIATCFLAVRLYCKRISRQGIWWDDLILVISWVVLLVASALLSVMVARGFGRHPWDQYWGSPNEILIMWVRNTLAMTAAAWSKTAFAVTLLRFADGWVKWAVWFILVTLNIVVALNSIMNWVGCDPIQRSWNPEIPGHCANILREIIIIGNIGGCECYLLGVFGRLTDKGSSIFFGLRFHACLPPLGNHLEAQHSAQGEARHWDCHELRYSVRIQNIDYQYGPC